MAVFTPINQEELISFLDQYEIGKLISFEGILEGIENTNFKIETESKKYILTIFEKRVNPRDLPFFVNLQGHLSKKQYSCPQPIANKNGDSINVLKGKSSILISYLDGEKTPKIHKIHCEQVGKSLGLFHKNTEDFMQRRVNSMGLKQWNDIFLKCKKLKFNKYQKFMPLVEKELLFLNKKWPKNLPEGIIHGDVFRDNVFFIKDQFSGLIDFYFSCNDFLSYDVAITINAWCFDNNSFDKNKFISLIKGYQSIRKINFDELNKFSILLRAASLRILITRIHDELFHPEGAFVQPKNPEEYIFILKFHQQENIAEYI